MISAIPTASVHAITSNQVVTSLETAVKELVENSLDAGATNLEVRFKNYGVKSVEVIDNGSGIAEANWDSIGRKHHTSKIAAFNDLSTVQTFGFRGEALASLCALCAEVSVTTKATEAVGVVLDLGHSGQVKSKKRVARQRGTTVFLVDPFAPLPVRRKEFERNAKREYGKTLSLLQAYALVPCSKGRGVRLFVTNTGDKGSKSTPIQTQGKPSLRASITALWGPKALEGIQDIDLEYNISRLKPRRGAGRSQRQEDDEDELEQEITVRVRGVISSPGNGRNGTDRQFLYVNGRPCSLNKVQRTINEVFKTFIPNHNTANTPLVIADFEIPTDMYDVNVTPDKRTLFLHNEVALIEGLKTVLETHFSPSRSTFDVIGSQRPSTQSTLNLTKSTPVIVLDETEEHEEIVSLKPPKRPRADSLSEVSSSEVAGPSSSILGTSSSISSSKSQFPASSDDVEMSSPRRSPSPLPYDLSSAWPGRSTDTSSSLVLTSTANNRQRQAPSKDTSSPRSTTPPPSRQKGKDKEVVVNTLFASWAKAAASSSSSATRAPSTATTLATNSRSVSRGADQSDGEDMEKHIPKKQMTDVVEIEVHEVSESRGKKAVQPAPTIDEDAPKKRVKAVMTLSNDDEEEKEQDAVDEEPKKKKVKVALEKKAGKQATLAFRSQLLGFARTGSKVKEAELMDEEDEINQDAEMEVDELQDDDPEHNPQPRPNKAAASTEDAPHEIMDVDQNTSEVLDLTLSEENTSATSISTPSSSYPIARPEVIRTTKNGDVGLRFDLDGVLERWCRSTAHDSYAETRRTKKVPAEAGVESSGDADSALARVISKTDFGQMDILGQFNLGFIIVRRRTEGMDDLFIVDQHAADEKYNFETLQETTVIKAQRLFKPRPLELTASDEMVALENMDVLRQNGFEVEDRGDGDEEIEEIGGGGRLRLLAQPVSKSTEFDMKDLAELIHLMHDRPSGQMVRCSKARAMFAMRACRKSVMIGMPLNKSQMTSVVRHMGKMDQPWNCPHGRPTMRHLYDLDSIRWERDAHVDWSAFV